MIEQLVNFISILIIFSIFLFAHIIAFRGDNLFSTIIFSTLSILINLWIIGIVINYFIIKKKLSTKNIIESNIKQFKEKL